MSNHSSKIGKGLLQTSNKVDLLEGKYQSGYSSIPKYLSAKEVARRELCNALLAKQRKQYYKKIYQSIEDINQHKDNTSDHGLRIVGNASHLPAVQEAIQKATAKNQTSHILYTPKKKGSVLSKIDKKSEDAINEYRKIHKDNLNTHAQTLFTEVVDFIKTNDIDPHEASSGAFFQQYVSRLLKDHYVKECGLVEIKKLVDDCGKLFKDRNKAQVMFVGALNHAIILSVLTEQESCYEIKIPLTNPTISHILDAKYRIDMCFAEPIGKTKNIIIYTVDAKTKSTKYNNDLILNNQQKRFISMLADKALRAQGFNLSSRCYIFKHIQLASDIRERPRLPHDHEFTHQYKGYMEARKNIICARHQQKRKP